jgi:hypothetical protein
MNMTSQTRDGIALYLIAAVAVLCVLYADVDLGTLFHAILARW